MTRNRIAILAGAAAFLFLVGFVPGFLRARSLDHQVVEAQQREQVYKLRDLLGAAFLQTTLKNYGVALGQTSQFFTEARTLSAATASPELRAVLEGMLGRRDDVTAKMAQASPEVYGKMQALYKELRDGTDKLLADRAP